MNTAELFAVRPILGSRKVENKYVGVSSSTCKEYLEELQKCSNTSINNSEKPHFQVLYKNNEEMSFAMMTLLRI